MWFRNKVSSNVCTCPQNGLSPNGNASLQKRLMVATTTASRPDAPLIVGHVLPSHPDRDRVVVRHWLRRVAAAEKRPLDSERNARCVEPVLPTVDGNAPPGHNAT